jgi:hypothetical protein
MNTAHACAIAEYVDAWAALQGRSAEWLLSAEGDRAFSRYTQALVDLGVAMDEDEAA